MNDSMLSMNLTDIELTKEIIMKKPLIWVFVVSFMYNMDF